MENEKRKKFKTTFDQSLEDVIKTFKTSCSEMPIYVCMICKRCMFKKQVQNFKMYNYRDHSLILTCMEASNFHKKCVSICRKCALWICR